jgi:cell wall-associated NlpC family hydrolase
MNTLDDFRGSIIMKRVLEFFQQYKSLIFFGLSLLAVSLLLVGCAAPSKSSPRNHPVPRHPHVAKAEAADVEIEKQLRRAYRRWRGTQHRLGGTGSRGIDCSGFVRAVYKDVFGIALPRTTRVQVRQGRAVHFEDLRAGDLVFFRPPSYPRHVGIYLGRSEFVHASKNRGVTISKMDRYYWGKYYWTARRILSANGPH